MKFIITENRVNEVITNYLDKNYGDLNWTYALNDDGDETDCAIEFYEGDYSDEEVKFRVYNKCWWKYNSSDNAMEMHKKSPILIFENYNEYNGLEGYFGDTWIEPFKKWFEDTYEFKLKTVEY